jgi:hypothetical protein
LLLVVAVAAVVASTEQLNLKKLTPEPKVNSKEVLVTEKFQFMIANSN